MIKFLIGFIIGTYIGIAIMCLLQLGKSADLDC